MAQCPLPSYASAQITLLLSPYCHKSDVLNVFSFRGNFIYASVIHVTLPDTSLSASELLEVFAWAQELTDVIFQAESCHLLSTSFRKKKNCSVNYTVKRRTVVKPKTLL